MYQCASVWSKVSAISAIEDTPGFMGIIEETEEKLAALKLRLPELEGKANKNERTKVNKDIYNLENAEAYLAALKERLNESRAEAAKSEDAAHEAKLRREEEERKMREADAVRRAEEKAKTGPAQPEDDGEVHMEISIPKLKKACDETVKPVVGDKVGITYVGKFADGTKHEGIDYSGKEFDNSMRKQGKGPAVQTPLTFKLGDGRAIRGWEEALKTMALGEEIEVTIRPKWAYRKGGLQDDNGKWIVPPNASLVFQMRLVQVREQTVPP